MSLEQFAGRIMLLTPLVEQFYEAYKTILAVVLGISFYLWYFVKSLRILKDTHSNEIFAIWYIFSFFLVLFFGLTFAAEKQGVELADVCGSYSGFCRTTYSYLTNIGDELILVGSILALGIIPQLLTYVLSGITGSASTPRFILQVEKIAVWSLIKFIAGLAGIMAADPFAKYAAGKSPPIGDFIGGPLFVGLAFCVAAVEVSITRNLHDFWLDHEASLGPLATIHQFFTRNASKR